MGHPFRIYNTLSRTVEDFVPIEPGKVKLYVCGMTVYDDCHVGHACAMVVFDTFVRYLRHRDWDVLFVRNFTDVDDKIIARAAERGMEPMALAEKYIRHFHRDADALGLIRPDHEPKVSECIGEIQALIESIIANQHAYEDSGNVWFDVESYDHYGKLSHQNVDELRGADAAGGKRNAADFALWKSAKPGEPAWPSPWGPGRPGWHIECSAMSLKHLGERFDIHGGGIDLVFPHHENEIAQSECGNKCSYANYWMHNGLLTMSSGQKMGKSLGNVFNVCDVLEVFPAETLRMYYLQNLYRSALPWSDTSLSDALGMLARLYEAREKAEAMGGTEAPDVVAQSLGADAQAVLEEGQAFEQKFYEALDNDFNTGKAVGILMCLARSVNRFANHKKAKKRGGPVVEAALKAFHTASQALGLMGMTTEDFHAQVKTKRLAALGLTKEAIESRLDARLEARAQKDWQRADELRNELDEMGLIVMDTPEGVEWRIRL